MAVGGKKREGFGGLKQGFFEAKVIKFSPDKEELLELLDVSEENESKFKDQVYVGDKDGVKNVRIDIWLQATKDETFTQKKAIFLEKKTRVNKTGKLTQFINTKGQLTWADDEANLPSWFVKNGEIREALVGEELLYNFLRSYLTELDFKDESTELNIDTKALFNGKFDELNELIGSGYEGTVTALAEVRTVDKDGEVKQYQNINDNFLPGYFMKQIKAAVYTPEKIEELRAKNGQPNEEGKKIYLRGLDAYVVNLTDPEYGSKNEYVIAPLEAYDSSKSFVASNEVINHDSDGVDY